MYLLSLFLEIYFLLTPLLGGSYLQAGSLMYYDLVPLLLLLFLLSPCACCDLT